MASIMTDMEIYYRAHAPALKGKKTLKDHAFHFCLIWDFIYSNCCSTVLLLGTFTGFKTLKDHAFPMYLAPASKIGFKRTPLRQW